MCRLNSLEKGQVILESSLPLHCCEVWSLHCLTWYQLLLPWQGGHISTVCPYRSSGQSFLVLQQLQSSPTDTTWGDGDRGVMPSTALWASSWVWHCHWEKPCLKTDWQSETSWRWEEGKEISVMLQFYILKKKYYKQKPKRLSPKQQNWQSTTSVLLSAVFWSKNLCAINALSPAQPEREEYDTSGKRERWRMTDVAMPHSSFMESWTEKQQYIYKK